MLVDQSPRGVAERNPRVHGVSCKQATRQCPLTAGVEQAGELFEIDRNALLIAVGASRANRKNAQRLRSAIESGDQVPIDLMCREALCLMRAKKPVCDEDSALTDGRIRDQIGVDPNRDVQADLLGVGQHQTAQIDAVR